ncbi:MAG: pitrilysin family protein [Bdellovibrionota bacterium]
MKRLNQMLLAALFLSFGNLAFATVEFEEDFSLPIVYFNIVVDVGASHDPKEKLGLAHVANQMMLRGTTTHTKNEFYEQLNRLGGQFEVETRNESTVFRGAVLSENAARYLTLIEEAFLRPLFRTEELVKLKKEVESEILTEKSNDRALAMYHFNRFFFGDHPYGNPAKGTRKSLARINNKDILNFYSRYFGSETLNFFGTGAIKAETMRTWFSRMTEKLGALHPEARLPQTIAPPPAIKGRRTLLVNKPNATQAQVLIGGAGMRPEMPEHYPVLLANHVFGSSSIQATLMQELRVKRGWTYGAYNMFQYGREPRYYTMYLIPNTMLAFQAINLTLDIFENFINNGISQEEFAFARTSLINNAPFNYDTPRKRLENVTVENILRFPKDYHKKLSQNIEAVKFEQVKPALKNFFNPESLVLVIVGDGEKLEEPLTKLPGFSSLSIKSYTED